MTNLTINRRRFLEAGAVGSLGLLAACNGAAAPVPAKPKPYAGKLGVQLYTFRALFEQDYAAVLKTLAEIGYKDLEFAGYFNHDPAQIKGLMDELGMASNSTHVRLEQMRGDFGAAMETAALMGQTKLILPWLAEEERTMDNYKAIADLMNERGAEAKASGMQVGYHNHEFEFETVEGEVPYDVLLSRTDPDLVTMELDFFWAHKANVDPIALFKQSPGRYTACHIKDADADGNMVNIGEGVIDFSAIFAEAGTGGLECFYVENDDTQTPADFARKSFAFLES